MGVQVVTGDSQEEVIIFRDTQTLHHNIYIIKQVSFGLPDKKFGPAADEETRAPRKILTITESYSLPEVKCHNNQYFTILYSPSPRAACLKRALQSDSTIWRLGLNFTIYHLLFTFSCSHSTIWRLGFNFSIYYLLLKIHCSHSTIWRRRTSSSSSTGRRTGSSARLRGRKETDKL